MLFKVTLFLLLSLIYLLGVVASSSLWQDFLEENRETFNHEIWIANRANFIRTNQKTLKFVCVVLWPLASCYILGRNVGLQIYDILTENKDECRIASWVV